MRSGRPKKIYGVTIEQTETNEYILRQAIPNKYAKEEHKARQAFQEGMILYGYCGGIFGRDSYEDKKIVKIMETVLECEYVDKEGIGTNVFTHAIVESWVDLLNDSNNELETREKYGS